MKTSGVVRSNERNSGMRLPLLPEVADAPSIFRQHATLPLCLFLLFSLCVESAPQYDLHQYMTNADLQYHFGVPSIEHVPDYDLSTPSYTAPYRNFPRLSQKRNWVYPSELHFDIEVFNTKYSIQAVRNDALVSTDF